MTATVPTHATRRLSRATRALLIEAERERRRADRRAQEARHPTVLDRRDAAIAGWRERLDASLATDHREAS